MKYAQAAFWVVIIVLFLFTRLPAMAQYLTIDNVNLALSLEKFDPRIHQPQPPGYPLFVAFNRLVILVFRDPARTFAVTGLLTSFLSLPLVFALGKRMFSEWVGRASVLLLLVVPTFWYASIEGPLRPHLALFSLLTAYCCWRCWYGEKSFAAWSAIALGIGAGFRPELGVFLFPLWLLSVWMGTRSLVPVLKALALLALVVVLWLGGMAIAVGGFAELYRLNVQYVVQHSKQQIALGAIDKPWLRQISRVIIWNSMPLLAALWAIPIFLKTRQRVKLQSSQSIFLVAWLLPGLLFQALVHIEDPGHTVFSIPALAIVATYLIFVGTQQMTELREIFLAAAVLFNSALFIGLLALPPAGGTGFFRSLKNSFLYAAFETSIGELRFQDDTARLTLAELRQFERHDVPTLIVSSDATTVNWFMNWRIARYYVPNTNIWVLGDVQSPHFVQRVLRDRVDSYNDASLKVPVPQDGRILWLLERNGPFHRALQQTLPSLPGGSYVSYTDLTSVNGPLRVMDFEFVPVGQ